MKIISREQALADGVKRYFTGQPCSRGHVAERHVSSRGCIECSSISDRKFKNENKELLRKKARERQPKVGDYQRQYYLDNKAAYKERSDRRYRDHREEILTKQKDRFAKEPHARAEKNRLYRQRNPEKLAQTMRSNYEKNRDAILERHRIRYLGNPGKAVAKAGVRRARKRQAVPLWFDELDQFVWQEAADLVRTRRDATGIDWAADHMIPLAGRKARGLHVAANCQVIPAVMNLFKNNKMIFTERLEWLK